MEEKIMDQTELANSVAEKIPYTFTRQFLIKPLDPIQVEKEFSTPVAKGTSTKDGVEATDYDEVATEIKKVDADFRQGVVIKIPYDYERNMKDEKYPAFPIKVGDVVTYNQAHLNRQYFDIVKDTILLDQYQIVAVMK